MTNCKVLPNTVYSAKSKCSIIHGFNGNQFYVQGELRVGKNMEPSPDSTAFGRVSMMMHWFHLECFAEKR